MYMYTTARLSVRPFTVQDVDEAFVFMSDPEVARYAAWEPYSRAATLAELERLSSQPVAHVGTWNEFAIVLQATQQVIGCVTCHLEDATSFQCEIGYFLNRAVQGQGYASEAVKGMVSYAISSLGTHRVFAIADERNTPSIALMERIGMRKEAHFQNNIFLKGEWNNEVIYAILASEWRPHAPISEGVRSD